jgi:hypothetical protein
LNSLRAFTQMMTGLEQLKAFVDGDDACVVFDARPFAPLFEGRGD